MARSNTNKPIRTDCSVHGSSGLSSSELLKLCDFASLRSLALIGTAKNAGKTTTLNHLIAACRRTGFGRTLALSSIGRDGEDEDVVTGGVKPRIYVQEGTLLATAVSSLSRCDALLDIRSMSGVMSAFGEIVIARALSDGYVELAGPAMAGELAHCEALLREEEPDCLFIVDGALSRRSPAGGGLTEAAILAANCGRSARPADLTMRLQHAVSLLTLAPLSEEQTRRMKQAIEEDPGLRLLAFNADGSLRGLRLDSLLGKDKELEAFIRDDDEVFLIRGAVTEGTMRVFLKLRGIRGKILAAEDGTRLFINPETAAAVRAAGLRLRALSPLSLKLVSFNPRLEDGSPVDPAPLLPHLQRSLPLPVYDLGPALV